MRQFFPPSEERAVAGRVAQVEAQLLIVIVVVVLQLWLLTVALEELLAGRSEAVWTLAVFSGFGFLTAFLALVARRGR